MRLAEIVQRGWDAVGSGDFDALVADYVEGMTFIMPGQSNVLEGRQAFRAALDGLGEILPPGFEIVGLRQIEGSLRVKRFARNGGSSILSNGKARSECWCH